LLSTIVRGDQRAPPWEEESDPGLHLAARSCRRVARETASNWRPANVGAYGGDDRSVERVREQAHRRWKGGRRERMDRE